MRQLQSLLDDECGFVISAELVLVATLVVLGMITGLKCIQVAIVGELQDVGAAIGSLNQSYSYSGFSKRTGLCGSVKAFTRGSIFIDADDSEGELFSDLVATCTPIAPATCEIINVSRTCGCGALVDDAGTLVDFRGIRIDRNRNCYNADDLLLGRIVLALDEGGESLPIADTIIDQQGRLIDVTGNVIGVLQMVIDACGNVIEFDSPGTRNIVAHVAGTLGVAIDDNGATIDFRNTRVNAQGIVSTLEGSVIGSLGRIPSTGVAASRGILVSAAGELIDLRGTTIDCHGTIYDTDGLRSGSLGIVVDSAGRVIDSRGIVIDADGQVVRTGLAVLAIHDCRGVMIGEGGITTEFTITLVDDEGRLTRALSLDEGTNTEPTPTLSGSATGSGGLEHRSTQD